MNFQLASQKCFVCVLVMTFCLGIVGSALGDTITFRTVALTDDPAPGTAPNVEFSLFFRDPVIDGAGHCAFVARLTGPDVDASNDAGAWSEGSGSLVLLARAGDPAPGLPAGVLFATCHGGILCTPSMNDVGDTTFPISLSDGSDSIWVHRSGSLNLVAREGTQAPGLPAGVNFARLFGPLINDAGQTGFSSYLEGPGVDETNNYAVWSEGLGSLAVVARLGDPAPGTPEGVVFVRGSLPLVSWAIGGAGQTPMQAFLAGPGVIPGVGGNDRGIWSGGPGSLELIARAGDPAPGLGEGLNFDRFLIALTLMTNGAGQTSFFAYLIGPDVDNLNDGSIWSEGSGSLAMVAREGSRAPGMEEGVNVLGLIPGAVLNGAGQTAFVAYLIGPGVDQMNNSGVWSEGSGALELVAREGSPAPGTAEGVTFSSIFPGPVMNANGQVAFTASLNGEGVDGSNNFGVWAEDRNGLLTLVIREGDRIEVAPGDVRTVLSVFMNSGETFVSGGEDGRGINFNDARQLVFRVIFTDFSGGILVSSFSTPGDLDGDGSVGVRDLLILFANWGPCADCDDCPADLDGDCVVNTADLLILFANWG